MSLSISNVMNNYTYGYGNTLRPNLDSNRDGNWSKQEVNSYASAYEKATGSALNVDDIFNKYDEDTDGVLNFTEYENAIKDDALGIDALYGLQQSEETTETEDTTGSSQLVDWLSTLTNQQKVSLTKSTFWAETTSNLISSMFSANNGLSGFAYAINQYNTVKTYGTAQYMNSLMPTFDLTV